MLASLVALVVPPRCLACGAPVAAGRGVCADCHRALAWIADPCGRCGLPRPCAPCPAARAAFSAAWAPVAFDGT
ncbi:MAG: hypothetical protein QOG68_2762, partial [Solirubrobacteraceae bacterium]|nr:hypothetical protein [Solirubrobacteraceae bacterium]